MIFTERDEIRPNPEESQKNQKRIRKEKDEILKKIMRK
jgi:hypothetical protein